MGWRLGTVKQVAELRMKSVYSVRAMQGVCACECVRVCVCETESEKADENKLFHIILCENHIPFS